MKLIMTFLLAANTLILILFLIFFSGTAIVPSYSTGIIGGADGPTAIIVSDSTIHIILAILLVLSEAFAICGLILSFRKKGN